MSDLFLPTLEMMGLTFAIGFFVAFIIKLIASAADSLDFYSSHQQELLRLRRIKKFRQKMELMLHTPPCTETSSATTRAKTTAGVWTVKTKSLGAITTE